MHTRCSSHGTLLAACAADRGSTRVAVIAGLSVFVAACILLTPLIMADIYLQRGRAAAEADEAERAVDLLTTALFWDDDNPETWRELGDIYLRASQAALQVFIRQNRKPVTVRSLPPARPGEGIVSAKVKVTDLSAGDVRNRVRKGAPSENLYTEETVYVIPRYSGSSAGYEKKAVEAYRSGIRLNPGDPRLYLGLAETMQFAASYEQTAAVFRKAAKLDPNNPNIHFADALFNLRNAHKSEALLAMRTTAAIYPVNAGEAFRTWLENGGSEDDLKSIAGTSPTALAKLGVYFAGRKETERSRDAYLTACRAVGGNADYRRPNEEPAARLLPFLLDRLAEAGLAEEHAYYQGLWGLGE